MTSCSTLSNAVDIWRSKKTVSMTCVLFLKWSYESCWAKKKGRNPQVKDFSPGFYHIRQIRSKSKHVEIATFTIDKVHESEAYLQKQSPVGALSKRCSYKFRIIHRTRIVPEPLFNKIASLPRTRSKMIKLFCVFLLKAINYYRDVNWT